MEWFGITCFGPADPFKDMMRPDYKEPSEKRPIDLNSIPPKIFADKVSELDCYIGHADGYSYRSNDRLRRMHKKGIYKPVGPTDMHRYPGTEQMMYGWFLADPALENQRWYKPKVQRPIPMSDTRQYVERALKIDKLFRL